MGFGGGDFGGGGSDFGGGGYDHYDSYSSSGGSGGGGKGDRLEFLFILLFSGSLVAAIVVPCVMGFADTILCTNGESLNPKEQMWCTPSELTTVTANTSSNIRFYRLKKSNLPEMVERVSHVSESRTITRYSYRYFSFVMNPGSYVDAELTSDANVDCLLLDYENMVRFTNEESYLALAKGKSVLNVKNFTPKKSDSYFFAFGHSSSSGAYQSVVNFNMTFRYNAYNVKGLTPSCSDSTRCVFENVSKDEIIIADNTQSKEYSVTLYLPDDVHVVVIVVFCVLVVLCILSFVGAIFSECIVDAIDSRKSERSNRKTSKESTTTSAGTTDGYNGTTPSAPLLSSETKEDPVYCNAAPESKSDEPPSYY